MTIRIAVGVVLIVAGGARPPAPSAQSTPATAIEIGKRVYEREKCASCHQIANRGNSRFPLDGVGTRLSARDLRRWMTNTAEMEAALSRLPAIRMSARKYRLNDEDLDALVTYLQTLK